MKVNIRIERDDSKEDYLKIRSIIDILENNNINSDQQKLEPSKERKYFCNNPSCKKEITKDIVAFCLHDENKPHFKGKVYCRDCQLKISGGESA